MPLTTIQTAPSQSALAYLTANAPLVATGGTWQTVTSWTDILTTPDQPFAAGEMPLPSATECWKAKISGTIVCGAGNTAALEIGWAPLNNGVEDLPNRLTDIVDAGRFLNFSSTQILTGAALRTWKFRLVFSSLAAGTPYLQKGATVEITRLKR